MAATPSKPTDKYLAHSKCPFCGPPLAHRGLAYSRDAHPKPIYELKSEKGNAAHCHSAILDKDPCEVDPDAIMSVNVSETWVGGRKMHG
jgi:hypothetical protein